MDRRSILQAILWVVLLIAAFVGAISANMWWTNAGFGDSVRDFQAIVTAIAILIAAYFAFFKLQIFRAFAPHLTISQSVSHRPIGDSYIHIDVSVTLRNSSRVKIELLKGFFLLQQISPAEDKEVERLYTQVFGDMETIYLLWPTLDEVHRTWDEETLVIEPGETHQEVCEFIVTTGIKSVLAYSYFYNNVSSSPTGWYCTTIHDIP